MWVLTTARMWLKELSYIVALGIVAIVVTLIMVGLLLTGVQALARP
jgi:hypothetical protein